MAFLSKQELKSAIRLEKLARISDEDDLIIQQAINTAITEVQSRLTPNNKRAWGDGRLKYDVKAIFEAEGNDRNTLLVDITKVVALWWLILRNNAGVDYEVIRDRYSAAIEYLKDLASGEANDATLPVLVDPVDEDGNPISEVKPFRMGSRRKFNHE